MKLYYSRWTDHGAGVFVEDGNEVRILDPRYDLRIHSTSGFEWGSTRPGSAQLALALAADVLGDDRRAESVCHALRSQLVESLPKDEWMLTEQEIRRAIDTIPRARGRSR
jgi:hypothetical protein